MVVYIAQAQDKDSPALEAIGHWPDITNSLPPVELDPELRAPSIDRRWYPIQEEAILLGVLRVPLSPIRFGDSPGTQRRQSAWHSSRH